jgi:uncharacterized alkaline shock family protein YloU
VTASTATNASTGGGDLGVAHQEAMRPAGPRDDVTHTRTPDGPWDPGARGPHLGPDLPRAPAEDRGTTTIAERVVAKIAAQAAREALRGSGALPEGGSAPHAVVVVRGGHARVRVGVELDYPSDIGGLCGAVRSRVAERVQGLAGLGVHEVVVQVERLHSAYSRGTAGRLR